MSNKLKKKNNIGFKKKIFKEDINMRNQMNLKETLRMKRMGDTIKLMNMYALWSLKGFGRKRLLRYDEELNIIAHKWFETEEMKSADMFPYIKNEKFKLDEMVSKIPFSQKIYIYGNRELNASSLIDSLILAEMMLAVITLKLKFNFTYPDIIKHCEKVIQYFDDYHAKQPRCNLRYLGDDDILLLLRSYKLDYNYLQHRLTTN